MSSATRTIRPYQGVEQFQAVLDRCQLHVGLRKVDGGSRASLNLDEYLNEHCRLVLAEDDHDFHELQGQVAEGLGDLALSTSDVEMIVLASAPRLKMVDVIYSKRLDELPEIPRTIPFPPQRPRALQAPNGGCDIRVFFSLAHQFAPQPLHPWRKGTWLGKQEYLLRSELGGVGFRPVRLTDELRTELDLHADTTRYALLDEDHSAFDTEVSPDAVKIYVDETLLDKLAVAAHTAIGKQMQRQLFLDAAWAIVLKAIAEVASGEIPEHADIDEFDGSLVHGLVEILGGRTKDPNGSTARNHQYKVLVHEPSRFLANLEARMASRRDVMEIFED